jgi:RecA-family ATPase
MVPPEEALCEMYIKSKDTEIRFDTTEGLTAIEREICGVEPQVVVFDPLSKFHLQDENAADAMGKIMRTGDYLIQKYGISIIYVHHTGLAAFDPQNLRRGGARLRGSSAIFADVDTYIEVANISGTQSAEPTLKLSLELRQGEPLKAQYVKRQKNGRIVYIGEENS